MHIAPNKLLSSLLQAKMPLSADVLRLLSFPDGSLCFLTHLHREVNSSASTPMLASPSFSLASCKRGRPTTGCGVCEGESCQVLMPAGLVAASEPVTRAAVSLMHLMACRTASLASPRCCTQTRVITLLRDLHAIIASGSTAAYSFVFPPLGVHTQALLRPRSHSL